MTFHWPLLIGAVDRCLLAHLLIWPVSSIAWDIEQTHPETPQHVYEMLSRKLECHLSGGRLRRRKASGNGRGNAVLLMQLEG